MTPEDIIVTTCAEGLEASWLKSRHVFSLYRNDYGNNIQQDVNADPCNSPFSQKESTVEALISPSILAILNPVVKRSLGAAKWHTAKKAQMVSNRLHHKCRCVSPAPGKCVSAWTCSSTQAGFTTSECVCERVCVCVSVQRVQYAWFGEVETEIVIASVCSSKLRCWPVKTEETHLRL